MMMVNGNTWPYLDVDKVRYRFRFLNGCQSRFLILDFNAIPGVKVWVIGNEGGFLSAPVNITADHGNRLLMGLAERADVIVDFTDVPPDNYVLGNVGPDEPFKGFNSDGTLADGEGGSLPPADPDSTGQVMQFRVMPGRKLDLSTPPQFLVLPAINTLPDTTIIRTLALSRSQEKASMLKTRQMRWKVRSRRLLGNVNADGNAVAALWMDPVTENPAVGAVEVWEFYNTTADAHPMHVHEVVFEVVNREGLALNDEGEVVQPIALTGVIRPPEPWETGFKDTVTAYPGEVTRIRARFDTPGQFVWHCHIVEHEDNEMMRPYRVGPVQAGQPG